MKLWFVARGLLAAVSLTVFTMGVATGQSTTTPQTAAPTGTPAAPTTSDTSPHVSSKVLEKDFFAAIRSGDAGKVLSYIPKGGVNAGTSARHITREEVEQQFHARRGLYCDLFDSACMDAAINLGNSARLCSDRELLTHSEKVRTASSEMTRNGVQQAVLVAEVKNDHCSNPKLIDFIFNLDADGWKLFSIP